MTARNTTEKASAKKETKTRAKADASKTPAKRGRPRKVKSAESAGSGQAAAQEPIDETGVKIYSAQTSGNDTPFSFEAEESAVSSFGETARASVTAAGESVYPVQPDEQAVFQTESDAGAASGLHGEDGGTSVSWGSDLPESSPAKSSVAKASVPDASLSDSSPSGQLYARAFEPVSSVAESTSDTSDGSDGGELSAGFGAFSPVSDDGNRREVEFELAQERVSSTMTALVESQRTFFYTGQTRDVNFRILQLKKLYGAIRDNEALITEALQKDLAKSPSESYATEIGLVLHEIRYVIRHLKKWARPRRKQGELHLFPAHFKIYTEPLGVSLIMSTWNYPILLSLDPIVSSIAAGNTIVLKLSENAEASNAVLKAMLEKTFNRSYMAVVQGGYTENHALLEQHFDFIFFTGSQNVGRIVMTSAARFLTPVCLELGGKSPCIVDSTANLELTARRIVWGKFLNAGQTCVAPDYVLVDKGIKDQLITLMKDEIRRQFGEKPLENKDYPKIINERRFVHLSTLCPKAEMDFVANKISPTIMDLGDLQAKEAVEAEVMQEEIFGPLLPVLSFDNLNPVMTFVSSRPVPLSLYLFSTNAGNIRRVMQELRFGGGCVNDVVFHLASSKAPFGGEGESGMGNYHGIYGFETFSHKKSVLIQSPKMDMKIRYAPYTEKGLRFLKMVLR